MILSKRVIRSRVRFVCRRGQSGGGVGKLASSLKFPEDLNLSSNSRNPKEVSVVMFRNVE